MTETPGLAALVVGDDPTSWAAAGFTVTDDAVAIGRVHIRCTGDGGGADRWCLDPAPGVDVPPSVDGIATATAIGHTPAARGQAHANGISRFDHVVVRSPDLDRTTEAFGAIGLEARRTRDATIGDQPIRQRFFWLGDVVLELVGAPTPSGDGPASIWGYALVADDLDATTAFLGPLSSAPRPAVQPGRRIATLRTRDLGIGVAVALMSPHR